ncbi:MAG: hypothetical protein ABI844_04105 [Saprospiraceae bacterium]
MKSLILSSIFTFFLSNCLIADTIPQLFEPGTISDELGNRDVAISPNGHDLFYTLQYRSGFGYSVIMHATRKNGKWSKPEVADFSGIYNDLEPSFSPDGNRLYFASSRPISGSKHKDYDIWFVTKMDGKWTNPINAGSPINSDKDEFYPSVTKSGNIYFTRDMEGSDEDIVVCILENGKYVEAKSLPEEINSKGAEFNAFVDPDEGYVIFTGYKRPGNFGSGDLFISKKNKFNKWQKAINLGGAINGNGLTYCPYVSPDKKNLFFASSRGIFQTPFEKRMNLKELKLKASSPWNGNDNIYWIPVENTVILK